MRWETQSPFPVATKILGLLLIFKRSQASSPFDALDSMFLSRYQRVVRPPVEMRWGNMAFYTVSTGDSYIPSCCEMKDEPAFKSLQGNQALFRVRASWCPFHLRQQTQGPSHLPIADRSLLLRCEWKVGIWERKHGLAYESLQGNQPFPRVRETWYPFHLRQQTQHPSHIPTAERSLLLRCLWKVDIPHESFPGHRLSF